MLDNLLEGILFLGPLSKLLKDLETKGDGPDISSYSKLLALEMEDKELPELLRITRFQRLVIADEWEKLTCERDVTNV